MKMQKLLSFRNVRTFILLGSLFLFANACEKPAGYGGTSRITGTIQTSYYNDDYSDLIKQGPAIDEEVFLMLTVQMLLEIRL